MKLKKTIVSLLIMALLGTLSSAYLTSIVTAQVPTITWMNHWTDEAELAYWAEVTAAYEAETGVHVELQSVPMEQYYTTLMARVAANDEPDMLHMPSMWIPALANWKTMILAKPPSWVQDDVRANWKPVAIDSVTWKGIVWGYPSELTSWALVYNRWLIQMVIDSMPPGDDKTFLINTLNKLEARNPYQPLTWAELARAARLLTQWGTPWGITGFSPFMGGAEAEFYQFLSLLWSNGGEFLDLSVPEVLFDTENGYEVMQLLYDLGYVEPRAYDPMNMPDYWWGAWVDETVAMMLLPTWMSYIRSVMGENFNHLGIAPIPIGPHGTESVSAVYNWLNVVTQKAQDEGRAEAAWAFLKWINEPKPAGYIDDIPKYDGISIMGNFLISECILPSRISDQADPRLWADFWKSGFMKIAELYGRPYKPFIKSEQVQTEIGLMFDRVVLTGADPTVEVHEAAQRVSAVLPISGDIDLNGEVDIFEVVFLIDAVTTPAATPASSKWVRGRCDFNDDDIVNVLDIAIYIQNFGRTGDP
jgi:multiple sugar transport system substrate-binding protein